MDFDIAPLCPLLKSISATEDIFQIRNDLIVSRNCILKVSAEGRDRQARILACQLHANFEDAEANHNYPCFVMPSNFSSNRIRYAYPVPCWPLHHHTINKDGFRHMTNILNGQGLPTDSHAL